MATVTLKNVPLELVEQLKREARQNRRSLNQEAPARLEASLAGPRRSGPDAVEALRRLHRRMAGLARVEPSTEGSLRLAARAGVSAYDAEFVLAAEAAGSPLVTAHERLARALPGRVVALWDLPLLTRARGSGPSSEEER